MKRVWVETSTSECVIYKCGQLANVAESQRCCAGLVGPRTLPSAPIAISHFITTFMLQLIRRFDLLSFLFYREQFVMHIKKLKVRNRKGLYIFSLQFWNWPYIHYPSTICSSMCSPNDGYAWLLGGYEGFPFSRAVRGTCEIAARMHANKCTSQFFNLLKCVSLYRCSRFYLEVVNKTR